MPGATMFEFQPGQAEAMLGGIAAAVGGETGLTPTQADVLGAIGRYVFDLDTSTSWLRWAPLRWPLRSTRSSPAVRSGAW